MQELIQEEKKAINRYIESNKLEILSTYPADGVFGDKQYYKSDEGVYFRVVEKGDTEDMAVKGSNKYGAVKRGTEVLIRVVSKYYFALSETSVYQLYDYHPCAYIYGIGLAPDNQSSIDVASAWVLPLEFVGNGAVVDMIVPSEYGTSTDRSSFYPAFYKNVSYRFR